MTKLDIFIIAFFAIMTIASFLVLRFAPTYISNRSKRYIRPKRKGVK